MAITHLVCRILTDMWHPNIDKEGKVCISILHEPGQLVWVKETW